jgi:ABC-type branched-subunit amino acid transport system substrate-binding protein
MWLATALAGAALAGCGGSGKSMRSTTGEPCRAVIGLEAPLSTQLGREQLAFAKLAVADDNAANKTKIKLVKADTRMSGPTALAATNAFVAKQKILAVVGPATGQEVAAVGPVLARAEMAFVSGSATTTSLTAGANPTFFRVVARDSLQGPQQAQFAAGRLHPRAVAIVSAPGAASAASVNSMVATFRARRILVTRVSLVPASTGYLPAAARITPQTSVVMLLVSDAASAVRFRRALDQQRKRVTVFVPDRLYAPGSFVMPGAYVAALGPDISAIPADAGLARRAAREFPGFGVIGPPAYAATHVVDAAIARVCRASHTPSRGNVVAAIRGTDERTSILGVPIRFDAAGDLVGARWFLFHISADGQYKPVAGA